MTFAIVVPARLPEWAQVTYQSLHHQRRYRPHLVIVALCVEESALKEQFIL